MKRNRLFVYLVMLTILCCGTAFAQPNPGPGDKKKSSGPGTEMIFGNDEATPAVTTEDFEKADPKTSVKKEAVKKAGAVAVGGVAAKKAKDIVKDNIKE